MSNLQGRHCVDFHSGGTSLLFPERKLAWKWFNKSAAQPFNVKTALRSDELLVKAVGTFVSRKIL
jgi:hypothetical protein